MNKILFALFFSICCFDGHGQIQPIVLGKAVTDASIGINPKNTDHIIVGTTEHQVYITSDGGKGWKAIKVGEGRAGKSTVTIDKKGDLYFYSEGQDFSYYLSSNDGNSWEYMDNIGDPGKKKTTSHIIFDKNTNTHYANWTQTSDNCKTNTFFSMSGNGKKWSPPIRINGTPGGCEEEGTPLKDAMTSVSSDGKLFITWVADGSLFLDRSYDKGKTWLRNDMLVTRNVNNGTPVFICDYSNPHSYDFLFLNWTDHSGLWFMRSSNFGDNWASPIQVNAANTYPTTSWMVIDEKTGILYIAYGAEDDGIYLAYSRDGGNIFTTKKVVGNTPESFIHLAAYEGRIALVWNGKTIEEQPALLAVVTNHVAIFGEDKVTEKKKQKKNK